MRVSQAQYQFTQQYRAFHGKMIARSLERTPLNGKKLSLGYNQLLSGLGDLVKRSNGNAEESMLSFHKQHILRIVDLERSGADAVEIAGQLSDLRQALAIHSFRLAAKENEGNFALAIGGSVIKRDHTYLTDIDLVVISASEEDREAALRTQEQMFRTLNSIYIETDDVMPFNFECLPAEGLMAKFPVQMRNELTDPYLKSMWSSNGSFFRFLMDLKIIDIRGRVKRKAYDSELLKLQDDSVYDRPAMLVDICKDSFEQRANVQKGTIGPDGHVMKIKNDALRQFYYMLYAARAKHGVRASSPWQALKELCEKDVITGKERERLEEGFGFFLRIRHIIGRSFFGAVKADDINKDMLPLIARGLAVSEQELEAMLDSAKREIIEISGEIIGRI